MRAPELSIQQIVAWARDWFERTGKWPTRDSGRIAGSLGETWQKIDLALRRGGRGLPYKSSLAMVLLEHCGVRNRMRLPRLTQKFILEWSDHHYSFEGSLPNLASNNDHCAPGETWAAIDRALRNGCRGLPGGSSLAMLLRKKRGYRTSADALPLNTQLLLEWLDFDKRVKGEWPTRTSGPVAAAPGETWARINNALIQGVRGLPCGSSLAQFLAEHRNVRNRKNLPPLRIKDIVVWAKAKYDATGRWPTFLSGPVEGAPGETWGGIHSALYYGTRGLPGGSSLYQVLRRYFNVPAHRNPVRA